MLCHLVLVKPATLLYVLLFYRWFPCGERVWNVGSDQTWDWWFSFSLLTDLTSVFYNFLLPAKIAQADLAPHGQFFVAHLLWDVWSRVGPGLWSIIIGLSDSRQWTGGRERREGNDYFTCRDWHFTRQSGLNTFISSTQDIFIWGIFKKSKIFSSLIDTLTEGWRVDTDTVLRTR